MPQTTINHPQTFTSELLGEIQAFLKQQEKKFPRDETLTIDLHCHDHNSSTPDELLGRILNIPETWLPSEDLIEILKGHGCDTFTVTNHNNARSCYELRERGVDVLTGAEFTCQVPDYRVGTHVLAYGFTPSQETMLEKLRSDIYRFQDYAAENDIPTIWAHPLYHYHRGEMPPIEFFEKMALVFERFDTITVLVDEFNCGPDRFVEIVDGPDHPPVVVGVIDPVYVPLFEHDKKAVPVLDQGLEGGIHHF